MEYKLIEAKAQGLPSTKDGVYIIPTIIWTGIVGQTYDGFKNVDIADCPILNTDNTIQIQAKMDAFGADFITKKYPNT